MRFSDWSSVVCSSDLAPTSDSSLARVVHIVEEAQERKGSSQRLAERIARPLVPGVMVVAVAIAVVGSILGDPELRIERALENGRTSGRERVCPEGKNSVVRVTVNQKINNKVLK